MFLELASPCNIFIHSCVAFTSTHWKRTIHPYAIRTTRNSCTIPSLPAIIVSWTYSRCRRGNKVNFPSFSSLALQHCKTHEWICESLLWRLEFVLGLALWKCFENWGRGGLAWLFFSPSFPAAIWLKRVFLTAFSVKLSGEFRLVLSRWLHPRLDYSLGFKPGPVLRDAVWHFSLAYKRLPYIGPGLLSLCLPLHWPPTEQ